MKRYILALGIIVCGFVSADAASLFGKVVAVNSGDVITIYNLNRPVRVKLMGVDAPEMDQAFGEVAKKHLADLVFEKSVVVEYAGIASDSSLTGRVLLNDADIGAQMIRDGAAWFVARGESDRAVGVRQSRKATSVRLEGNRRRHKAETQRSSAGTEQPHADGKRNECCFRAVEFALCLCPL